MVDRVDRQLFWGCPEIVNTSDFTAVGAVDQQRIVRWTGSFFTAARVDVVAVEHLGVLHPAVGGTHVRVAAVGLSLATVGVRGVAIGLVGSAPVHITVALVDFGAVVGRAGAAAVGHNHQRDADGHDGHHEQQCEALRLQMAILVGGCLSRMGSASAEELSLGFGLRDLHALHTCSSSLVATVVSPLATWVEKIPSR